MLPPRSWRRSRPRPPRSMPTASGRRPDRHPYFTVTLGEETPRRWPMDTDMLQSIYAHASWANGKLFDAAAHISEAQLTEATDGSDSIFNLLLHLVDVERTWLARAQHTVASPLDPASCSTLTA